jgi:limonene-1,2-epoxide hydrolase
MRSPAQTIAAFVKAFIAAWPTGNAERLGEFFSDDAAYHNGPLPPVKGRKAIVANLAGFMALGGHVDVDMIHILSDGPLVMTERVDHFTTADGKISLPVMGTFEVQDGVITSWRDYFDLSQFSSQLPTTD